MVALMDTTGRAAHHVAHNAHDGQDHVTDIV